MIAALELSTKGSSDSPGLELAPATCDVVEVPLENKSTNRLNGLGSRTETRLNEVAAKAFTPEESQLRLEVLADKEVLEQESIAVGWVIELGEIRLVVAPVTVDGTVKLAQHGRKRPQYGAAHSAAVTHILGSIRPVSPQLDRPQMNVVLN